MTHRLPIAVVAAICAGACAPATPLLRQECVDPDAQLERVLGPYEELRAGGCDARCVPLRREIERLAVVCFTHTPTLMANAVLAYDDRRLETSQQLLDLILSRAGSQPEAAVLRAKIAIEEGNLPFAARLLTQQIKLAPDRAALHEMLGATQYLSRQYANALRTLGTAAALGAPQWRIAYHRGLIQEAEGRLDEAARSYTEALSGNPGWAPAQSRLNALRGAGIR